MIQLNDLNQYDIDVSKVRLSSSVSDVLSGNLPYNQFNVEFFHGIWFVYYSDKRHVISMDIFYNERDVLLFLKEYAYKH